MLLSASATPACHPLLLDGDMPPATVPMSLCGSCLLLLPWALFPPELGWVLPSGSSVRYLFNLCCAEPGESPFSLHTGPGGGHTWCPVCDGQCQILQLLPKKITVLLAHTWHLQRSDADQPQNTSNHALAMQQCRKPSVWEKHPLILIPIAVWEGWTPVRSRASD